MLYSPVTAAEIWHGARPQEHGAIEALLGVMTCVSIDAEIGPCAGDYLRQYAKSHHVELGDALIAATAAVHSLVLWTRKPKALSNETPHPLLSRTAAVIPFNRSIRVAGHS